MRSYKQYVFSLFFLVALILGLYFEQIAQAIPAGQRDCDTTSAMTSSASFVIVPGTSVTVNNGTTARQCVIQFSSEVSTTAGDLTDLIYAIDSTNPANCRPIGALAFHIGNAETTIPETHTHIGVSSIEAGTHTIRPCFRAIDLNGGGATSKFFLRCMTVECRTQ